MNSRKLSPLELPRSYNAATHFIDRHLDEGRASKIAVIDEQGSYTYAQLAERVNRAAGALLQLGLEPARYHRFSHSILGSDKGGFGPGAGQHAANRAGLYLFAG